jgi:repressor LexA
MITHKQRELLVLIRDRLADEGVPPSFDEMKDALGLKSKSGIHRLITGLEERGFIKRMPHRARALEITRMPDGIDAKAKQSGKTRKSSIPANMPMPSMAAISAATANISLPLYGRIAAGRPIEAIQSNDARIEVPAAMLASGRGKFNAADHYALEVSGDSMIEAGILDGDRVIIRKCDTAENGAIVVALIDDNEATLKYIERRHGQIALIPANKNYRTQTYAPGHVKVQGKLVSLVRKY